MGRKLRRTLVLVALLLSLAVTAFPVSADPGTTTADPIIRVDPLNITWDD